MKRKIVDYVKDEHGDWVAKLACYHGQHVRHQPPFFNRSWTETKQGREQMVGEELDCVRCDELEFPEGLTAYKRTPEFTEGTIPKGLLNHHSTKAGTWGMIHVLEGVLIYMPENHAHIAVKAGEHANIPPQMIHAVKADEAVRFYVEFYSLNISDEDKKTKALPTVPR